MKWVYNVHRQLQNLGVAVTRSEIAQLKGGGLGVMRTRADSKCLKSTDHKTTTSFRPIF
jgi:hypothetical protein